MWQLEKKQSAKEKGLPLRCDREIGKISAKKKKSYENDEEYSKKDNDSKEEGRNNNCNIRDVSLNDDAISSMFDNHVTKVKKNKVVLRDCTAHSCFIG